jgi:hypothetical protein
LRKVLHVIVCKVKDPDPAREIQDSDLEHCSFLMDRVIITELCRELLFLCIRATLYYFLKLFLAKLIRPCFAHQRVRLIFFFIFQKGFTSQQISHPGVKMVGNGVKSTRKK